MAITYAVAEQNTSDPYQLGSAGKSRVRLVTLSANSGGTYTAGGDTVTAASLGFSKIHGGTLSLSTTAGAVIAATLLPQADGSAKVKLFVAAGAEQTAATVETGLILTGVILGAA